MACPSSESPWVVKHAFTTLLLNNCLSCVAISTSAKRTSSVLLVYLEHHSPLHSTAHISRNAAGLQSLSCTSLLYLLSTYPFPCSICLERTTASGGTNCGEPAADAWYVQQYLDAASWSWLLVHCSVRVDGHISSDHHQLPEPVNLWTCVYSEDGRPACVVIAMVTWYAVVVKEVIKPVALLAWQVRPARISVCLELDDQHCHRQHNTGPW
jgi:hypothetical protein